MSIESILEANTASNEKLSALLAKFGPPMEKLAGVAGTNTAAAATTTAAAATGAKPGRPAKAKGPTFEEVTAMAEQVKAKIGAPGTKAIIQKHGGAKLADLKPDAYAAFIADCQVQLAPEEAEADAEDGEDL